MIEQIIKLSWLWYLIISLVLGFALAGFTLYVLSKYHFGKALKIYFWGRMRSWIEPAFTVFSVCTLDNNIFLEPGRQEQGGIYRIGEKVKGLTWVEKHIEKKKEIDTLGNGIIPLSVYTINGVKTVPVLDTHPKMHTDVLKGVNALIDKNVLTLQDFTTEANLAPNKELFPGYTYAAFYDLYMSAYQKYNLSVTVDDVLNFTKKNIDENYRETIEAKNSNIKAKARKDSDYSRWGWYAVFLFTFGLVVKLLYFTFYVWSKKP